jgi:arylsulfatase A-like enzyme
MRSGHPATAAQIPSLKYTGPLWGALFGCLVGSFVGLAELPLLALRRFWLGHILYLGPHAVWMAPAANLVLFAVIGAAASIAARLLPAPRRAQLIAVLLASAASLALLLHVVWLALWAAVVVSLGLGIQLGQMLHRRRDGASRLARVVVPIVAALILLTAAALGPALRWREARLASRLPAPAPDAPNIILLILDTVRALNVGAYGYARPTTPHLDSLATRGALFERAYATTSWTLPSHGSLFTGREAYELSTDVFVPLDTSFPTLAERLGESGYATAGFVANQRYANSEWGLARGFGTFEVYPITLAEISLNASLTRRLLTSGKFRRLIGYHDVVNRKLAKRVNDELFGWLDRRQDRPFFAFLNYFDAHEPYLPPEPYATRWSDARPASSPHSDFDVRDVALAPRFRRNLSDAEKRRQRDAYDGAISYVDDQIGALLAELSRRGLLENTVLVVTSDHGEHLGEAGRFVHFYDLYSPALHVPLIIVHPGTVPAGTRVAAPVSLVDLPATLGELTGLGDRLGLPGLRLLRRGEGEDLNPARRPVLASFKSECRGGARFSVIVGRHQYIQDGSCGKYLFDVATDPLATRNLVSDPENQETAARLRALGIDLLQQRRP